MVYNVEVDRADHRIVVKGTVFTIVQFFVESESEYNDEFRKKANSNYELTVNLISETRTPPPGIEPATSR